MKLGKESLIIDSFEDLHTFFIELELKGILKFQKDLIDSSGNLLIKNDIPIRPSMMERLRINRGTYEEKFYIKIDPPLINIISQYLVDNIVNPAIKNWDFLNKLFVFSMNKPKNIVKNALKFSKFCLATYILFKQNKEHFDYLSRISLLTLVVILFQNLSIKGINIYSFISAYMSEFPFPNHLQCLESYDNYEKLKELTELSIKFCNDLDLPPDIPKILNNIQTLSSLTEIKESEKTEQQFSTTLSLFEEEEPENQTTEGDYLEEKDLNTKKEQLSEKGIKIISESIKFARYIFFLYSKIEDKEHMLEEISFRIAYVSKRGFFNYELLKPIISKFKELELEMRNLILIADIEKKCIYPPSAWAYPKPRATQIICRNHILHCPYLKLGWDLHVVKEQEPYGWIGTYLETGRYFKCKLEDQLPLKKGTYIK